MDNIHFNTTHGRSHEIIEAVLHHPALSVDKETYAQLRLAIEEIIVNVCSYAYSDVGDGTLDINISRTDNDITLSFSDQGKRFDPLQNDPPNFSLSIEEKPIGGLGIFLVQEMMDEVNYKWENGRNILTIKKAIAPTT